MKKFEQNLIKLANKLELKYLIIKYAGHYSSEELRTLIINAAASHTDIFPNIGGMNFVQSLIKDNVNVRISIKRNWLGTLEDPILTFQKGTDKDIISKYDKIPKEIIQYIKKFDINPEGGPWDFIVPPP